MQSLLALQNPLGFFINLWAQSSIPDIEIIFDKFFAKFAEKAGVRLNRQLDQTGEGLKRRGKGLVQAYRQYADDASIVVRLMNALTGSGRDDMERLRRHLNVLNNSLAQQRKTLAEYKDILDQLFRTATGRNYLNALRVVEGIFRVKPDALETSKAFRLHAKAINELNDAYRKSLPGVDIEDLTDDLLTGGFLQGKPKDRRRSRKAIKEAVPALFEGNTVDEGLSAFRKKLSDTISGSLVEGFLRALIRNGPVNALLVPFFKEFRKLMQQAMKGGSKGGIEELIERAKKTAAQTGQNLSEALADLAPFFKEAIEVQKILDELLNPETEQDKFNERLKSLKDLHSTINDVLTRMTDSFHAFVDAVDRLAQKVFSVTNIKVEKTDNGIDIVDAGLRPGAVESLEGQIRNDLAFFDHDGAGFTTEGRISFLQGLEQQVDDFFQAMVQSIKERFEPLIEIAVRAKKIFDQVTETLKSLKLSSQSSLTSREKLGLVQRDIAEQQRILRNSSDEDERLAAAEKLQGLFSQLLELGGANFSEASPEFRLLFEAVLAGLGEIAGITSTADKDLVSISEQMRDEIAEAGRKAAEFYDAIRQPLLDAIAAQFTEAQGQLDKIKEIIVGPNYAGASLADVIAFAATLTLTELRGALTKIQQVLELGLDADLSPEDEDGSGHTTDDQESEDVYRPGTDGRPTVDRNNPSPYHTTLTPLRGASGTGGPTVPVEPRQDATTSAAMTAARMVETVDRIVRNAARMNADLVDGVVAAKARAYGSSSDRSVVGRAADESQHLALHIHEGAIQLHIGQADRAELEALPPKMIQALTRQIQFGRLGAVIKEAVK